MNIEERKKLIGERIKEMRKAAKLTQPQLAAECSNGMKTDRGASTISEYEHGKNLNLDNIHKIAEVLQAHVPFDENYLLGCQDHPDITTSWIAEQIPLTGEAIEALKRMKYEISEYSDLMPILVGYYILSDLIIHFEKSLNADVVDDSGRIIEYDDFASNVIDLLSAYESIASKESLTDTSLERENSNKLEKLTIRGVSSWLGADLAETIRKSVKAYADPKHVLSEEA